MAYERDRACREYETARAAVAAATKAYSGGGSVERLNAANQRLADATYALGNPGEPVEPGRTK